MNRTLGHVLLWLGFLAAAFFACYQLEVPENKWATVPWQSYLLALAVGLSGVYILRSTAKRHSTDVKRTDAQYATIETSLQSLGEGISQLRNLAAQEELSQIVKYIDDEMTGPFAAFADARNALANRHGLQFFADVMTQFASAERYVNRVWSAAADGYIDEVGVSLSMATRYLDAARELISSVGSGVSLESPQLPPLR